MPVINDTTQGYTCEYSAKPLPNLVKSYRPCYVFSKLRMPTRAFCSPHPRLRTRVTNASLCQDPQKLHIFLSRPSSLLQPLSESTPRARRLYSEFAGTTRHLCREKSGFACPRSVCLWPAWVRGAYGHASSYAGRRGARTRLLRAPRSHRPGSNPASSPRSYGSIGRDADVSPTACAPADSVTPRGGHTRYAGPRARGALPHQGSHCTKRRRVSSGVVGGRRALQ
jgi:hypothetical protein